MCASASLKYRVLKPCVLLSSGELRPDDRRRPLPGRESKYRVRRKVLATGFGHPGKAGDQEGVGSGRPRW